MAADVRHPGNDSTLPLDLRKSRIPRYALPNASSLLPEYVNEGADYIYKTFHSGNYNYLRRLPEKIDDQSVGAARRDLQEQPFASGTRSKSPSKGYIAKGRLFQDFEYIPSPVTNQSPPRSSRAPEGRPPFIVPKEASQKPKYADYHFVEGSPEAQAYVDAYDVSRLEERLKREGELFGPFVPTSKTVALSVPPKSEAPMIIDTLKSIITREWPECTVDCFFNPEDLILVQFDQESAEIREGIAAFMNILVTCNREVDRMHLVKAAEHWNSAPGDGKLYFSLRPPWVKQVVDEPFRIVHAKDKRLPGSVRRLL